MNPQKRTIRRRRITLVAVIAISLCLISVHYSEGDNGPLHGVQRVAMDVLSPIQVGASKVFKPFSDLANWIGGTWSAQSERDRLKRERDQLRQEVARLEQLDGQNEELRKLHEIDTAGELNVYKPQAARVIARSPNSWYATVKINKGRTHGIRVDQPVINGEGLVGRVQSVSYSNAIVTLITDQNFAVSVRAGRKREPGIISPAVGSVSDLRLDLIPHSERLNRGDRVVTAGSMSSKLESLFPPGILVGTIKRIESGDGQLSGKVHVSPAANLHKLDFVQVLKTKAAGNSRS